MKSFKELLSNDPLAEAIMDVVEDNTNDKSDDGEGLDKVQPKAVKKKFKDRKDKDIDNDGDEDDSDEFLHKKRKAISKAMAKEDVDKADETPSGADDDAEDEAPKKKKKAKKDDKETPSVKDSGAEVVDTEPKLEESCDGDADDEPMDANERKKIVSTFFKGLKKEDYAKYGSRANAVMQKVAEKLADK